MPQTIVQLYHRPTSTLTMYWYVTVECDEEHSTINTRIQCTWDIPSPHHGYPHWMCWYVTVDWDKEHLTMMIQGHTWAIPLPHHGDPCRHWQCVDVSPLHEPRNIWPWIQGYKAHEAYHHHIMEIHIDIDNVLICHRRVSRQTFNHEC